MYASDLLDRSGRQAIARLYAQPRRVAADDFRDSRRIRESKIYPAMTFLGLGFPVVGPRMLAAELLRDGSNVKRAKQTARLFFLEARVVAGDPLKYW